MVDKNSGISSLPSMTSEKPAFNGSELLKRKIDKAHMRGLNLT